MPFQLHFELDMNALQSCVVAAATELVVGSKTNQLQPVMPSSTRMTAERR